MVYLRFLDFHIGTKLAQSGHEMGTKQNANFEVGVYLRGKPRIYWLREKDLNLRPLGYEPNELPDCSIARFLYYNLF